MIFSKEKSLAEPRALYGFGTTESGCNGVWLLRRTNLATTAVAIWTETSQHGNRSRIPYRWGRLSI